MSRFMIHLQAAHCRATGLDSSQYSTSAKTTLVFERTVGSLGSSLAPEDYFTTTTDNDFDDDDVVQETFAVELERL